MSEPSDKKKYDLEERTARFAESIIEFCMSLDQDAISRPLISQIIRSGTSIGANYMEANGASSPKDFRNKIYICKKESGETKYWLRMLTKRFPKTANQTRESWKECQELTLIFQKIVSTLKNKESLKTEN